MWRRVTPYFTDFAAGSLACFVGYTLMTMILGNYPHTGRGWFSVILACAAVGLLFAFRFFLQSLFPQRDFGNA